MPKKILFESFKNRFLIEASNLNYKRINKPNESNDWINKVIEKNDLYGLKINNFNLKTTHFLNENSDKIKIKINEKNDLVLPNICTAFYKDKLFISFCGIRS